MDTHVPSCHEDMYMWCPNFGVCYFVDKVLCEQYRSDESLQLS